MKSILSVICLAVVFSQAISAPTTQEFPEKYFGAYESQPEGDQNFAEFVQPFLSTLPGHVTVTKANIFSIRRDGEYYHVVLVFGPSVPTFDLKFKLGETTTVKMNGRNVEFVYTVETNPEGNPILRGKYRDTESDLKFTADGTFTPAGINVTYAREGVTAKRTYTRVPCPSIAGLYVNVPEKQSPNFLEFAKTVMPAPNGVTWDADTYLWLGRYGRDFIVKYIVTPSIHVKFPFRLNEKRTKELNGKNVTYTYTLGEENPTTKTTTLLGEFTSETGTLNLEAVITPEGITTTYKAGGQTATRYWKRTINALVYGTFENVPAASENWAEFVKVTGKDDDSTDLTKVQFYKQGNQDYFRVAYVNGKSHVYPFELNKTRETTAPNGTPAKYTYNERTSYSNDVVLHVEYVYGDKVFSSDITFNATGAAAVYRAGTIVARRFYRRQVPAFVLGKFESTPDTPEFTTFTQQIGSPELAQKTTVEFTETPEHTYQQTISVEGAPEPAVFAVTFGKQTNTTLKGKQITYSYFYMDYPTPVLHTYWVEANKGPTTFSVSAEFNPTGYTATYLYKGRLATRKYTRVGAPVPAPVYPTA